MDSRDRAGVVRLPRDGARLALVRAARRDRGGRPRPLVRDRPRGGAPAPSCARPRWPRRPRATQRVEYRRPMGLPPRTVRRIHLALGLVGLVAFVATGQVMDLRHGHLRGLADGPRLLFRSAHIYLLFSALVNLLLGVYLTPAPTRARRALQAGGSLLVAVGPPLLLWAFFREPWLAGLARPFSRPAIYASLAGVLLHVVGRAGAPPPG